MTWLPPTLAVAAVWAVILVLPWRPWRTREALDGEIARGDGDLSNVTVLIPARNEAAVIGTTLKALAAQGPGLKVVVVDDQSGDGTGDIAKSFTQLNPTVVAGTPLPAGWTGKLWAQEQGRRLVQTRLTLLLDADIELAPGTIATLRRKIVTEGYGFVSLMAAPNLAGVWERLLMPAYIYFFKLLYPFHLSNSQSRFVAAAAGGCVLLETDLLARIGGLGTMRDELIDDCTLARRARDSGEKTWIGLTHSASMLRRQGLKDIWNMVARTAFTQLHYSVTLLLLCTALMAAAFVIPVIGVFAAPGLARGIAAAAWFGMMASYLPTLRYYGLSRLWAPLLPVTGALYLAMTWTSALRYWGGHRSRWKDRVYARLPESET